MLRAVYPERPSELTRGRYVHQDYAVSGVQDMLTTWVPLICIPVRLGGLAVRPHSHLGPPERPRLLGGSERGWASTDYEAGDALVFHCLTAHAALPNRSAVLRLRGFPLAAARPAGPGAARARSRRGQRELFSRLLHRERWWEPVPGGLSLVPREHLAAVPPGPSRFFSVHPAWAGWQPPSGLVH